MKLRSQPGSIEEILTGEDEFGLLDNVPSLPNVPRPRQDAATINFLEIVKFVEEHGREPEFGDGPPSREYLLAVRLAAYREKPELASQVARLDRLGLLAPQSFANSQTAGWATSAADDAGSDNSPVNMKDNPLDNTLADIFVSDPFGLLNEMRPEIFRLTHIGARETPDEIASRKPCADFYRYEKMFADLQRALGTPQAVASRYRSRHGANVGSVFILRGLLCFIDCVLAGDGGPNPRLRVIFENATETDLLKNSLVRALFKDPCAKFVDLAPRLDGTGAPNITSRDRQTGYIYILETLSNDPALLPYKNAGQLVKIGYSIQEIEERVRNAENDPTFLEAPVNILATMLCYNLNPRRFESLIHAFLHRRRLLVEMRDRNGNAYHPREWFTIDCATATEICEKIINGTIDQYRMDNVNGRLVKREIN